MECNAADEAAAEILSCCGSRAWAVSVSRRAAICGRAESICRRGRAAGSVCLKRIGWRPFAAILALAKSMRRIRPPLLRPRGHDSEQSQMSEADAAILLRMQQGHREYEERFGRIFIVCASGKQPAEMLQHPRTAPGQRSRTGVAGVRRTTAADHAAQVAQVVGTNGGCVSRPLHPCARHRARITGGGHDGSSGICRRIGRMANHRRNRHR